MRRSLGKPVFVRQGNLVRITCRLPEGSLDARLGIWSGAKGFPLSPHTPLFVADIKDGQGRPTMHHPVSVRLHEHLKEKVFEFHSDEDLVFQVIQEVDPDDISAKVKIQRYGKVYLAIRAWLVKHNLIQPKEQKHAHQASASL